MEKKPLVSIIIPCYNKGSLISEAIESALNQTYSNIECLVIDDGSTDDSKNIVLKYCKKDKRLKYFFKNNGGPGSTRNFGVGKANGEWIQFLDADDWLDVEKIFKQINFLIKNNLNGDIVLYSDYVIVEQNSLGKEKEEREIRLTGMDNQKLIRSIVGRKFGLAQPTPLHVNNTLFKRSIFEKMLFDEGVYYEDLIFFYNLLFLNFKFIHTPYVGMYYRSNPEGISKVSDYVRIGYLQLLETVYRTDKAYLVYSPNVSTLLKYFVRSKNVEMFNRTMELVRNSGLPIYSNSRQNIRKSILFLHKMKVLTLLIRFQKNRMFNFLSF